MTEELKYTHLSNLCSSFPLIFRYDDDHGFITPYPDSPVRGDTHYYNRKDNQWNASLYPVPRMATEYGFQSFPSVTTLKEFADPSDLYWPSRFMSHRCVICLTIF